MASRLALLVLGVVALGALTASCQDPTQLTLHITTNAKCHDELNATAIFVGGSLGAVSDKVGNKSPVTQTSTCNSGEIGTLVVTPGNSDGAIEVVAGFYGQDPAKCVDVNYANCIVARRSFTFIKHTPLTIPIELERDCLNVPCDVSSTCHNGQCYSANITCASNGSCTKPEDGDAGPVDGGPKVFPDGQPEPIGDSSTLPEGSIELPDGNVIMSDSGATDAGPDAPVGSNIDASSVDAGGGAACRDLNMNGMLRVDGCNGMTCDFADGCCQVGGVLGCHTGDVCKMGGGAIACCDDSDCPGTQCCKGGNAMVMVGVPRFSNKPSCLPGILRIDKSSPGFCSGP